MTNTSRMLACAGLLLSAAAGAEKYENKELGFSVEVPDGFAASQSTHKDSVFDFAKPAPGGGNIALGIGRMHGYLKQEKFTLDEEVFRKSSGLKDARTTVEEATWKAFQVPVMRTEASVNGVKLILIQAQIPLTPEALVISVAAPSGNEAEERRILTSVVRSLDGKTNWLTEQERTRRLGFAAGVAAVLGLGCIGTLVALVLIFRMLTRKKQQQPAPPPSPAA